LLTLFEAWSQPPFQAFPSIRRPENDDLWEQLRAIHAIRADSRARLRNLRSFMYSVDVAARLSMMGITLNRLTIGVGRCLPKDIVGMITEFAGAPVVCNRAMLGIMINQHHHSCVR